MTFTKKQLLTLCTASALAFSLTTSSCIGSFALTNKLLEWNNQVSNKFVNEVVFIAFWIIPVYEISALADVLVINSVEFWSGSNPITASTKKITGNDGREYLVQSDAEGYTITCTTDGSVARLDYNFTDNSWSVTANEQTYTLFTFIDDTHVAAPAFDGTTRIVELSADGLMAYRHATTPLFMAAK